MLGPLCTIAIKNLEKCGSGICCCNLLTLSSCHPFDADPPEREHGAVVVNVQESNLVEFFSQDKEHCVQVLNTFGDEIPPQSSGHLC